MKRQIPKILSTHTVAKSRLFEIETVNLRFSNGSKVAYERLVVDKSLDAVIIVPMHDEQNILLAREYAVGLERYVLGLPKGLIEKNESPHAAANRELMEELGYGAHDLHTLHTLYLAPGFVGFKAHVIIATHLYSKKLQADEPEQVETVIWPIKRLEKMLSTQEISDSYSLAALYLARDWLEGTSKNSAISSLRW